MSLLNSHLLCFHNAEISISETARQQPHAFTGHRHRDNCRRFGRLSGPEPAARHCGPHPGVRSRDRAGDGLDAAPPVARRGLDAGRRVVDHDRARCGRHGGRYDRLLRGRLQQQVGPPNGERIATVQRGGENVNKIVEKRRVESVQNIESFAIKLIALIMLYFVAFTLQTSMHY